MKLIEIMLPVYKMCHQARIASLRKTALLPLIRITVFFIHICMYYLCDCLWPACSR